MDAITQCQNYVRCIAELFAHHTQILLDSPPISVQEYCDNDSYYQGAENVINRSEQLFERLVQMDTLLASLPPGPYSEEEQLQTIVELEKQNADAGERLNAAQKEAELWQKRISDVLCQSATYQLNSASDDG